jgi:hypothetical protein
MSKIVKAEYDAATHALRLVEPVDGLEDHDLFTVILQKVPAEDPRPWLKSSGVMSKEDGDDFARAIEEMFPPWTGDDD